MRRLRRELGRPSATQSWDDIYTLQGDVTEWFRQKAELEAEGCVFPVTDSTSTTAAASTTAPPMVTPTTAPPPSDPRLLDAADLGPDFADHPYRPDAVGSSACDVTIPTPAERVGASYSSQAALENAALELFVFSDGAAAEAAFAAATRDSGCVAEENLDEPRPTQRRRGWRRRGVLDRLREQQRRRRCHGRSGR